MSGGIAGLVGIGILILKEHNHAADVFCNELLFHPAEFSWSCPHTIGGCAAFKFEFSTSSVEGED